MKTLALLMTVLGVAGCAMMPESPGHVSIKNSKFEGGKSLYMNPAYVSGRSIMLGLFASSQKPNKILISAYSIGLRRVPQSEQLQFNVDGEIIKLKNRDNKFSYETMQIGRSSSNWTEQTYYVAPAFIEKLLNAESVTVRFNSGEGEFDKGELYTAKDAFKAFLKKWRDHLLK